MLPMLHLPILALLALPSAAATPDPGALLDPGLRADLAARLHVADLQLQRPTLDEGEGWLRLELELEGRPCVLLAFPHTVRAERFRVWSTDEDGELRAEPLPAPGTWRGHVEGQPSRTATVARVRDGVFAAVREADGRAWFVEPLARWVPGAEPGLHVVHGSADLDLPGGFCGADELPPVGPGPGTYGGDPAGGPGCFRTSELAFDVDFEYFTASGSSVPDTVANIEAVMAAVNLIFAHEVQIEHLLTDVVVRSSEPDPYSSFVPGELLDALRSTWTGPLGGIPRDHVHLATGREMDGNIIGLAYVGVLCNYGFGFGLTQFNLGFGGHVAVVAHELGHNWNAPHCLDPICGIMCGGCLQEFGPVTTDVMRAHRDAVGCLDVSDGFSIPVAPEAERDVAEGSVQVLVDVLANDLDGNCEEVVIESFDASSAAGGSVFRSVGTGPGGRDELRYVPPPGFQGVDGFQYLAGDGTGLTEAAPVTVRTFDEYPDLTGHWRLDETAGPALVDSGPAGMSGEYLASPQYGQPGAAAGTGTSVGFGGFGDRARILQSPGLRGLTEHFSISAWVRPDSLSGSDRVLGNGSAWRLVLRDGQPTLELDGVATYTHPVEVPVGAWTHLAATYRVGGEARLYVDGSLAFSSPASGPAATPVDEWYLGGGAGSATALFDGLLDDIQVYDHELDGAAVAALYADPGSVLVPCKPTLRFCEAAPNSTGFEALLDVVGTPSLAGSPLLLRASTVPAGQFGVFFFGPSPLLQPFGEGRLCVGGTVTRLAPVAADILGVAQTGLDLDAPPYGIGVGDRLLVQYWYRDPFGGPSGFNLSDAQAVEVCP